MADRVLAMSDNKPLYLMIINGEKKFLSIYEAGACFDSGWDRVEIGGLVLEADRRVRDITKEEERYISDIADEYSASK